MTSILEMLASIEGNPSVDRVTRDRAAFLRGRLSGASFADTFASMFGR
jgi:hypothetical protein